MKKILFILSIITLSSCSTDEMSDDSTTIDPTDFFVKAKIDGVETIFSFNNDDDVTLGHGESTNFDPNGLCDPNYRCSVSNNTFNSDGAGFTIGFLGFVRAAGDDGCFGNDYANFENYIIPGTFNIAGNENDAFTERTASIFYLTGADSNGNQIGYTSTQPDNQTANPQSNSNFTITNTTYAEQFGIKQVAIEGTFDNVRIYDANGNSVLLTDGSFRVRNQS